MREGQFFRPEISIAYRRDTKYFWYMEVVVLRVVRKSFIEERLWAR